MLQNPKYMTSPLTGGSVSLHWETRDMDFRKESFKVTVPYYVCDDTKEQFTTTESDNIWMTQLHNKYCCRHGIPFTDEIIALRARYGISALKMSQILGFGENQWRKYEQSEIPSLSNGKMIRSVMNANVFLDLVESSKSSLTTNEYTRIKEKVNRIINDDKKAPIELYETQRIYKCARSQDNGFAPLSLSRLKNILIYMLQKCGETFCTKMNKMLFYVDFLSYRERGVAMSGLSYRAISYGPVPENWDRVYSLFDEITQEPRIIGNYEGNVLSSSAEADSSIFSPDEREIMDCVCARFCTMSSREISEVSHKEKAWLECIGSHSRIPFTDAFALKAV